MGTDISVKMGAVAIGIGIGIGIGISVGSVETVLHITIASISIGIGKGIGVEQWKHTTNSFAFPLLAWACIPQISCKLARFCLTLLNV